MPVSPSRRASLLSLAAHRLARSRQVDDRNLRDGRTVTGGLSPASCVDGLPRTVDAALRYRR